MYTFLLLLLCLICTSHGDITVPNSGLIIGYFESNQPIAIRTLEKINAPVTCQAIRLNNSLSSAINKNGNIFYLIDKEDAYYDKYEGYNIYRNRYNQYLSYIYTGGSYGTWIIGDVPHVDSGLAYIRPGASYSWLPLTVNSYDNSLSKDSWFMMATTGGWSEVKSVTSECVDKVQFGSHIYKVQYIDKFEEQGPMHSTHLIPSLKTMERLQVQMANSGSKDPVLNCISGKSDFCIYDTMTAVWKPVFLSKQVDECDDECLQGSSDSTVIQKDALPREYPMGAPVHVSHKQLGYVAIGYIVNMEYVPEMVRFRLFIRISAANQISKKSEKSLNSHDIGMKFLANNFSKYLYTPINEISISDRDDMIVVEVGLLVREYNYTSIGSNIGKDLIQYDVGTLFGYQVYALHRERELNLHMKDVESSIELYPLYQKQLYALNDFGAMNMNKYKMLNLNLVEPIKIGDYVWIWVDDNRKYGDILAKCIDIISDTIEYSSVLSIENRKYIFSYTVSDRRAIMERSMIDLELNRLVLDMHIVPRKSNQKEISQFKAYYTSSFSSIQTPVSILYMENFNHIESLVGFMKKYIAVEEKRYGSDVPSCFFYHTGVSLPQQLVYGAELLCVLVGAKPISMVQYATPTDHQWKFPLVRELINIFQNAQFDNADKILAYHTNTYYKDSSLIVYPVALQKLADMLGPHNRTIQALHPVPYPDNYVLENKDSKHTRAQLMKQANEQQIYYSWWNGYILGYPLYAIDSYCKSFHNDLNEAEKIRVSKMAKKDVTSYVERNNVTIVPIGLGAFDEIPLSLYKYLNSRLPY